MNCSCGIAKGTRIVGGVDTEVNEYPWQVALVSYGSTWIFCGGSLISDIWVMTAAHCTQGKLPSYIQIILGEHDQSNAMESVTIRSDVVQIVQHPDSSGVSHDFSLVKLQYPINFPDYPHIRPVCLPPVSQVYTGQNF